MKITKLPAPTIDPYAAIVADVMAMPLNAFVLAHGDLYGINSPTSVDLMLRTGDRGFVIFPHHQSERTGLSGKNYCDKGDAEKWVRYNLERGATISIVDPNADAD